jgi:Ash protein family
MCYYSPYLACFCLSMVAQAGQPKGWPVTDEAGLLTLFELPPPVLATPMARSLPQAFIHWRWL